MVKESEAKSDWMNRTAALIRFTIFGKQWTGMKGNASTCMAFTSIIIPICDGFWCTTSLRVILWEKIIQWTANSPLKNWGKSKNAIITKETYEPGNPAIEQSCDTPTSRGLRYFNHEDRDRAFSSCDAWDCAIYDLSWWGTDSVSYTHLTLPTILLV